ncbi:LacI family DNA-binding transcriptional regulator [Phytoactinopolyspora mesophila]|uniref:LacI family DNA-binding transcriptional regulator n=1 Tax=Phytoactinopolyspora mesophila TaxID=2650750 RepID=A0A7K3MB93_9ACTN|nr:LacI family DNA-binding transcriptional regulator [Phytoactinopolyspora mesophila]NDL60595.1 LacI family DNA-binding transcriptional regulator [Phytoactinopolyspora mesophila]
MPKPTRVRLADVARRAGVSRTTASVVLNGKPDRIPEETQRRVEQAAAELEYRANSLARGLRLQRSLTIGLISDDIASEPFAGAMIRGAHEAAWKAGFMLVVLETMADEERARRAIGDLRQRQVDGFLYATTYHQVKEPPAELADSPTVMLDARDPRGSLSSVVPDEITGAYDAVSQLIEAGHRRIGYLQNVADIPATLLRLEGYRRALADAGIPFDPSLVEITVPEDRITATASARHLLDRTDRPTGLFCFSDRPATAAYDAAETLGLRVPDDVSIVGFDNLELLTEWISPGLTTMQLPHEAMGHWALEQLLRHIEDPDLEPVQHLMPCPLVVRQSVAPPSDYSRG